MIENDIKRLTRLTAILTQLQTNKITASKKLAEKFGVSIRTIYRVIRVLEKAGVPILVEERKGYSLMEGYRIPPVMFTENEANALITVEKLVFKNSDSSLISAYSEAISKIKAVLQYSTRNKIELLANRIVVNPTIQIKNKRSTLTLIQKALTDFKVLNITYISEHKNEQTERKIELFALYYSLQENWTLIAYCTLRKDYRMFRLAKILKIEILDSIFKPHKLTLKEFLDDKEKNFKIADIQLS
jgi:predicted DNA-binding transcriptional regulator YafY